MDWLKRNRYHLHRVYVAKLYLSSARGIFPSSLPRNNSLEVPLHLDSCPCDDIIMHVLHAMQAQLLRPCHQFAAPHVCLIIYTLYYQ